MRIPQADLGEVSTATAVTEPVAPPKPGVVAKGLEQLGKDVEGASDTLDKIMEAADHERVFSELEEVSKWKDQYIDGPDGAMSKKLHDAAPAAAQAIKDFEALGAERKKGLANGRQRRIFDKQWASQKRSVTQALNAHVNDQMGQAAVGSYKATVRMYKSDAARALAADDMKGFLDARANLLDAIDKYRPMSGWDKDMYSSEVTAQMTDFHDKVIEYLEDGKHYEAAKGYLETYRPEMDETIAGNRLKDINHRQEAEDKQDRLDAVWKATQAFIYNDPANPRFDEDKARAAFYSLDTEVQKGIEEKFFSRVARERRAQDERDVQALSRIGLFVDQFGELDENSDDYRSLDDQGKLKAHDFVKTYNRANRFDRSAARQEQHDLNEEAVRTFRSLPPAVRRDMTDEQIRANFTNVDRIGFAAITEQRETARQLMQKGLDVGLTTFMQEVRSIGQTYMRNEMERLRFFDAMQAKWIKASIGDHVPSDVEVNQWLAEATLRKLRPRQGLEVSRSEVWGYTMPEGQHWEDARSQRVPRERFYGGPISQPATAAPAATSAQPAGQTSLTPTAINALKAKYPGLDPQAALAKVREAAGGQRIIIRKGVLGTGTPKPGDEEIK